METENINNENQLGNNYHSQKMIDWLVSEFKNDNGGFDLSIDTIACARLKSASDNAIVALTSESTYEVVLPYIASVDGIPTHFSRTITREMFQQDIEQRFNKFLKFKSDILLDLDRNQDGEVDLVENDFYKLLNKNQKTIISVDKNYIHQFVKVSNFIKTKKQNTIKIFQSIRDTSTHEEIEERVSLLRNQIHSYELLVFHSINMLGALVSEDLITFYEIYEQLDKLGMFNSNWENEVSEKLTNIENKLDDLMYSIYSMEQNIVSELSNLSYITQESFEDLNRSVTSQLKEVESSINTNNLLTGIQAYQLYKINHY
jgi:hypothetical protein